MANANGWGDGASNNNIGWGKGADNAIGWGSVYSVSSAGATDIVGTPAVDPDAQAFITAASITDPTQQAAINQLVVDLKGYNIWSKMQAIYPIIGGTAASHKWNLKDPRDLNAAFRLVFNGGWTHSSTGATPNGTNAYANTFLNPTTVLTNYNAHASVYCRLNGNNAGFDIGNTEGPISYSTEFLLASRRSGVAISGFYDFGNANASKSVTVANALGFTNNVITSNTFQAIYKNGVNIGDNTNTNNSVPANYNVYLAAVNDRNTAVEYTSNQYAFASIGNGLTPTDAANFYTAVQAFQTTLGRSIGTQTVSDADAQAFVTNAGIVDQVEANAINNLVIGLKADGLWTKMKAVYPMVGGSSSTMKYNLKNPLDTDAAFRLVFNGGWTFSSNGATPNGTNAFADTKLIPSTALTTSSAHFSKYNRTNDLVGSKLDGVYSLTNNSFFQHNYTGANALIGEIGALITYTQTDSRGLFTVTRTATNVSKLFKNTTQQGSTNTTTITNIPSVVSAYIGARNGSGTAEFYNTYQCAFASIGDGLSDTDVTNLNTRVTTFQTALNRNV